MVREFADLVVATVHVLVGAVWFKAMCYGPSVGQLRAGVCWRLIGLRGVRFGRQAWRVVGVIRTFAVLVARRRGSLAWVRLAPMSPAGLGVVSGTAAGTTD